MAWSGRFNFGLAVLNWKMYMVGGWDDSGYKNDVWESSDGIYWSLTLAQGSAPFGSREQLSLTAFDGYMWLIAGFGKASNESASSD